MKFSVFVKWGLGVFLLLGLIILIGSHFGFLANYQREAWTGLFIGLGNFLIGSGIISWGFTKENKKFMGSFFGGMISRLFIVFFILFVLVYYLNFNKLVLLVTLLISYFSYLIVEILIVNQLADLRSKRL